MHTDLSYQRLCTAGTRECCRAGLGSSSWIGPFPRLVGKVGSFALPTQTLRIPLLPYDFSAPRPTEYSQTTQTGHCRRVCAIAIDHLIDIRTILYSARLPILQCRCRRGVAPAVLFQRRPPPQPLLRCLPADRIEPREQRTTKPQLRRAHYHRKKLNQCGGASGRTRRKSRQWRTLRLSRTRTKRP